MKTRIALALATAALISMISPVLCADTNDAVPSVPELISRCEKTAEKLESMTASYTLYVFSTNQKFAIKGDMSYQVPFFFKSVSANTFGPVDFNQTIVYDGQQIWQMTETHLDKQTLKQILKKKLTEQGMMRLVQQPFQINDILDPCRMPRLLPLAAQSYALEVRSQGRDENADIYILGGRLKSIPPQRQTIARLPLPLLTSIKVYVRASDGMLVKMEAFDAKEILILDYELNKINLNANLKKSAFTFKVPAGVKVVEIDD